MSDPFLSEIRLFSFSFPPKGWAFCNGQTLPINQNQPLFALLGTTFGGNGQTTFALPNLQGRVPIHSGNANSLGQSGGAASVTLSQAEMPAHNHLLQVRNATPGVVGGNVGAATKYFARGLAIIGTGNQAVQIYGTGGPNQALDPSSVSQTGGSQPHSNMQPFLTLNYCIALQGIFPSQN
jgi:microcystin-dependent protein